jgi:hypothetical protein
MIRLTEGKTEIDWVGDNSYWEGQAHGFDAGEQQQYRIA